MVVARFIGSLLIVIVVVDALLENLDQLALAQPAARPGRSK
jgi:hypothetical protein